MTNHSPILSAIFLAIGMLFGGCLLRAVCQISPPQSPPVVTPEPSASASWDEWMVWHKPRCAQCTASFDQNAFGPMCEAAFKELQARLKRPETPSVPEIPDTSPINPPKPEPVGEDREPVRADKSPADFKPSPPVKKTAPQFQSRRPRLFPRLSRILGGR